MLVMNISGDWLYFSNSSDEDKLYRVSLDGSATEKVSDVPTAAIYVMDGDIYYLDTAANWYFYDGQQP